MLTKAAGAVWYKVAMDKCLGISERADVPIHKVVGVVAVISPKMSWENNLRQAEVLCKTRDCSALSRSKANACNILDYVGPNEELVTLIRGKKTRSFFCNIANIGTQIVTLDSHMGEICGVPNWTPRQYDKWEEKLVWMAQDLRIEARALQATLWLHHKNQKLKINKQE